MIKNVLKEVIIMLLIGIVVLLIMSIVLYDNIPINKVTPSTVAYTLPDNLQEELDETLSEEENKEVLVTYTVSDKDLKVYENTNSYDPGKLDPFADNAKENTNPNNTTNTNGTTNSTKPVGSNSTGNIFDNGTQK